MSPGFTPVAVPTVAPVNIGGELAQAAQDAPVNVAENAEKVAAAKAATDQAGAQQDDLHLSRIAPALAANPALANTPAMKAILGPILQRRGFSPGQDGNWDPKTLSGILNPQKPFSAWTQEDVDKAMASPPEQRVLPPDAPDWLKTEQVRTPMTPVGLNQVFTGLAAKEKLLSDAKSGYQPAMFLQDVQQTKKRLEAAGNFAEAASLNEYLNADGTGLNDAFVSRHVGEQAQAEIDKIHSLGIHLANEDEYKTDREKDLKSQFDRTLTFKYADLQGKERIAMANAQRAQTRLDQSQTRLNAYLQSVDLAKQRFQRTGVQDDFRIYKAMLTGSSGELDGAQKSLDGVTAQINSMSQNAKLRNSPLYQSLIDQAASLNQFIQTQGPMLRAEQYDASQSIARTYSQITGTNVQQKDPPAGGPTLNGRPIRPNAQNTGWEFYDGSPVPAGK
jgi:hypothetical protein